MDDSLHGSQQEIVLFSFFPHGEHNFGIGSEIYRRVSYYQAIFVKKSIALKVFLNGSPW